MSYVIVSLLSLFGPFIRRGARFAHRPDPRAASYLKRLP